MSSLPEFQTPRPISTDRAIADLENPQSLIYLVPPDIAKEITLLDQKLLEMSEEELDERFPDPTASVMQVRRLFWLEFDRAIDNRQKMDMSRCYSGVVSRPGFMRMMTTSRQLAWIINPPKEYLNEIEDLHYVGLRQIREILKAPVKLPNGMLDPKIADVKLKAWAMLDLRLKGGYISRSLQINHNTNTNNTTITKIESGPINGEDPAALLDRQILEIENKIKATQASKVIELNPGQPMEELQKNAVERHVVPNPDAEIIAEFKSVE